ncbi:MAG: asparaginase [Herbaspirillum sp.]|jgi:L-asparaginase|nr:asparaginase [Herbaspirillum sp.]
MTLPTIQPAPPPAPLHIIATGGTLDKHYDEIAGVLRFDASHLPAMIARARFTVVPTLEELPLLDSLDMQDIDRRRVLASCEHAEQAAIVVIHGTDTMHETGELLGRAKMAKTIVLTGAMIPYAIDQSDAQFNLGFACGVAQFLPHGVYIAMNGQVFDWDRVRKNRAAGVFERTS